MTITIVLVALALVLLVVLGARGRKQRDNAAEAARRAVEARLEAREEDAASHQDKDSRA
ncbi:hypothetical protein [Maricaulis sp.]|uniref:hypothetical protein n=1 Tax=Maricaulis sp. TaxID=1486257 RepID=UPI0025BD65BF|nr:hypothetical protein [Maricaulis sp.]